MYKTPRQIFRYFSSALTNKTNAPNVHCSFAFRPSAAGLEIFSMFQLTPVFKHLSGKRKSDHHCKLNVCKSFAREIQQNKLIKMGIINYLCWKNEINFLCRHSDSVRWQRHINHRESLIKNLKSDVSNRIHIIFECNKLALSQCFNYNQVVFYIVA